MTQSPENPGIPEGPDLAVSGDATPPELSFFATIDVDVDAPIAIGTTVDGLRKVVPIRGGKV